MNNIASLTSTLLLLIVSVLPASASLADRAGIWATQPIEITMVSPDGARASADLGPARTAALGHLDSDGVIDLAVAYASEEGAFAVVTLGDPRFRLGPHHDLERERAGLPPERPFATEGTVYPLPFAPDWTAIGDWDSDGDFDVVFAAEGRAQLFWMAGDGRGRLDAGRMIDLEGGVTAFVSGDVNRRDGLDDLVVAVAGKVGASLLVFEDPGGALKADPEKIAMPNVVSSLAVDWLDGDVWKDIAATAGNAVILISGRDRKLSSTQAKKEGVPPAAMVPFDFESKVVDVATGFFTSRDREAQLAVRLVDGETHLIRNIGREFERSELGTLPPDGRLLSARSSGLPGHDLLVADASAERLEIFHVEVSKTSGRKLEPVPSPDPPIRSVIAGRLNVDSRDDLILLGEDGTVEVAASKSRIAIVVDTTDDIDNGGCQYMDCSLREAIISANIQPAGSTITFDLPFGATIEPTSQLPTLTQTVATIIDGTVGSGMITGLLTLQGASAGNAQGLDVTGGNATIRHMAIRGFTFQGINLETAGNNTVEGCRLGVDVTGGGSDANRSGIRVYNSNDNTIGGTAAGAGNVCSGNEYYGVYLYGTSDHNVLLGNLIGLETSGNAELGNGQHGVRSFDALRSEIGSAVSGGGNLVSGNGYDGIYFFGSPNVYSGGALVLGNVIGLNAQRTAAIPNGSILTSPGIYFANEENISVGGTNAATRNVISGNSKYGIEVRDGSPDAVISGNYIGTDGTGLVAIPNQKGIMIVSAESLTIGGTTAGSGNLISGNQLSGISAGVGVSSAVDILGNRVGVADDGSPLGNGESGVYLYQDSDVLIGGWGGDGANTIAHNGAGGVVVGAGCSGVHIDENSIYDNTGLGIDLGDDGPTVNDSLDADTGPNGLQNFPLLNGINPDTSTVFGILNSLPSTTFSLLFFENPECDPLNYGEGKVFLGSQSVSTDAAGSCSFGFSAPALTPGSSVSAIAMAPDGNTSEFSMCFQVPANADEIFSDGFESGTGSWSNVVGT